VTEVAYDRGLSDAVFSERQLSRGAP
jgi:hypothetical protein